MQPHKAHLMTQQTHSTPSTLVLGLGKTGFSVVQFLCARGEKVTVADSRDLAPSLARMREQYPQVEIIPGGLPTSGFDRFDRIVVSPGIAMHEVAASQHTLIGDIELFVENANAPIIAITGSNGKSSVTTLVGEMLQAAGRRALTGGNIGTPALDLLTQSPPDFYVLELSSFQLESTHSLRAVAAAILNISEDHLDRYDHMERYIEAKAKILNGADACVLNRDDPRSAPLLAAHPEAITFGINRPATDGHYGMEETHQGRFLCRGSCALAAVDNLSLHGEQNIANVLAALALVESAGVPATSPVVDAAIAWGGLEHRCELVAEINGVKWINDSKGTNVGATVAALRGFGDDLILIAGGLGKGADFSPLQPLVGERVRHAVLFGRDAERIAESLASHTEISRARDLPHAVCIAAELAQAYSRAGQVPAPGPAPVVRPLVLFSPACASFDAFENYQQRGKAFKQLVAQLVAQWQAKQ